MRGADQPETTVRLEPGGRASYAGGEPQTAGFGQMYHFYTDMRPAADIATCMYHTGLDPFTGQEVRVAKGLRDRKMLRALMQFFEPEDSFMVREGRPCSKLAVRT